MIERAKRQINNLLDWLSFRLKVDVHYFTKSGIWLSSRQILVSLSGFAISVAFANLLPKETYGNYKYVISIIGLLTLLSLTGVGTSFAQSVAKGYEGNIKKIIKIRSQWALIGSVIALVLAGYNLFLTKDFSLALSFSIAALFLPVIDSLGMYNSLFLGRKDFKNFTKFNVIELLVNLLAMMAALIFLKKTALLIFVFLASYTIIKAILLKHILKKYPPNRQTDDHVISYGKHLTAIEVINNIAKQIDKVLAFHFVGPIGLANYAFITMPVEHINNLMVFIPTAVLPKFANREFDSIKKTFFKKIFLLIIPIIGIIIVYSLLSPLIYKFIFPKYSELYFLSAIYSLILLNFIPNVAKPALQAHKKVQSLYWIDVLSACLKILFIFIGGMCFGIVGLVVGQIIGQLMMSLITWIIFVKTK